MMQRMFDELRHRLMHAAVLAVLFALAPIPAADRVHSGLVSLGAAKASAQGGMDIGILTPSFSQLPRSSLLPGETFTIGVSTVPGARCSGQVTFRGIPPIALDEVDAPAGNCSWDVTVPPTVRPSTATIVVPISRNSQWWTLYGIVYVRPVGEAR